MVDTPAVAEPKVLTVGMPKSDSENTGSADDLDAADPSAIICPVCGGATVQEKCKVICKSDICRGRVVLNCAEF